MSKLGNIVHVGVSMLAALLVGAGIARAQTAPTCGAPPGPAPTGLVVGSGNFYSPIVANLEEAVAFYRDGIGFDVRGEPTNADTNPQLMKMFGLPDARLRQQIGRAAPLPGGVEIVELSRTDGERVERRIQDPGTVMLTVSVRDIDATLARLKQLGAPVVTTGGAPVALNSAGFRGVLVKIRPGTTSSSCRPPGRRPRRRARTRHRRRQSAAHGRKLGPLRRALSCSARAARPRRNSAVVCELAERGCHARAHARGAMALYDADRADVGSSARAHRVQGRSPPAEPPRIQDAGSTRIQLRVSTSTRPSGHSRKPAALSCRRAAAARSARGQHVAEGRHRARPRRSFLVLIQAPPAPQ